MPDNYTRRDFLRLMGLAAGGIALSSCGLPGSLPASDKLTTPVSGPMKYRALGGTGQSVSLLGLGGEGVLYDDTDEARQIINHAIDQGVNYLDTSPTYGSGQSETNIGQIMQTRRGEVFLATKTYERGYDGVMTEIEASLSRLNTDYVDLYQMHSLKTAYDLERIFRSDGALRAMQRLRDEGVIRNIGVTGHYDPSILLQAINQYPFDTILMSLNAADRWYLPFQEDLLQTAVDKKMGIIAMKVAGLGRLVSSTRLSMEQAMQYVFSFPVSSAIIGVRSFGHVDENVAITTAFGEPLSPAELEQIELEVQSYHEEGNFMKV
jgi:aryl-alcohol dehydrogenase-like predicted oxidoreductase